MTQEVSPQLLDWALNGIPVQIWRRPTDHVCYATTHDFRKFIGTEPLETMRIKAKPDTPAGYDFAEHPKVKKRLAELNAPAEIRKAKRDWAKRHGDK